jgi:hypothetical protein
MLKSVLIAVTAAKYPAITALAARGCCRLLWIFPQRGERENGRRPRLYRLPQPRLSRDGLIKFLDHIAARDRIWICTGRDIVGHWRRVHPG